MTDEIPSDVTGGDLNALWRVANVHFPQILNAYNEPITDVHTVNGSPDDGKFGRCHPWWTAVACQLEESMFFTVGSLYTTQIAINRAIDAYTRVDGNNALALNQIGEEMTNIIDSENGFDDKVDWDFMKGYDGPNHNVPDSWSEALDE